MNKQKRKQVKAAIHDIENVLQNILEEEQEAYENMIRDDQKMDSECSQENLEYAIEALEEAISYLEDI